MKNKKTKVAIIGIIALVLVTIGITYAYWLVTRTQEGENVITTGCLDITLNGENDITLTDQFPISDEEGMKLTPYTFTVTNNCTTSVDYHINLESIGDSSNSISSDSLKAVLNTITPKKLYDYVGASTTVSNAYEAYTLGYGTLAAKSDESTEDTATYELRLWIDKDAPISEMNKTYTSKISVMIGQGISSQGTNLSSLILADAETNGYLKSETPDFSTVTADGEYGLYSAEDDFGTSYYFRGDVTNNYVKLGEWQENVHRALADGFEVDSMEQCEKEVADGIWSSCESKIYASLGDSMYWRIVRINGDGTIRLIYDGVNAIENGISHIQAIDNAVAAPYGEFASSRVFEKINTWYENNLIKNYEKYIVDEIFCNDSYISRTEIGQDNLGESIQMNYYAGYDRLLSEDIKPKFICEQKQDKLTVSETKGNGLLKYPIGLITADELVFAGANAMSSNNTFYIGANRVFTMTYSKNAQYGEEVFFFGDGKLHSNTLDTSGYIRPVINLKADVQFIGDGTIETPYEIVME